RLRGELAPVARLMFQSSSVQARLEGVGVVPRDACEDLGFVGPVARACEVLRDVRHDHPYGIFRFAQIPVANAWAGDVFARALAAAMAGNQISEFPLCNKRFNLSYAGHDL